MTTSTARRLAVVPVDGSGHARQAIEFAVDWAKTHDGTLHFVHVPEMPAASDLAFAEQYSADLSRTQSHLEAIGEEIVVQAKSTARSLGWDNADGSVAIGNAAQQIVTKAETLQAEMIIMGTRGNSEWKNLLLGSVSHKVMQMAPCTCVVVR